VLQVKEELVQMAVIQENTHTEVDLEVATHKNLPQELQVEKGTNWTSSPEWWPLSTLQGLGVVQLLWWGQVEDGVAQILALAAQVQVGHRVHLPCMEVEEVGTVQ
jgi:hypothetical protein